MLSSGNNMSRSADILPLSQCLPLEPIVLDCQKYTRSGELRRVLGVSLGSSSEEHTFGAIYLKPSPPVATEELKNFKDSVQDASRKARDRAKMFRESIFKLDKYREALSSKKRQRNGGLSIERPGVSLSKNQILRTPQEQATPRYDDKSQSAGPGLKKRIRTSMVNADGRSAVISRQQIIVEKDRDLLKVGGEIQIEEKMRNLAGGGEGWEKKLKRKRSVGAAGYRSTNGERELKKDVHPKMTPHAKLRTNDALGFRSRSATGMGGVDKTSENSELISPKPSPSLRNELENVASLKDRASTMDERVLPKGNNMLGHEENSAEKISRAQKAGSVITVDLSPHGHQSSGTIESLELPFTQRGQALGLTNDNKRPLAIAGSSANSVTHWGGQRPQKILRTKRSNVASPVASNDETHISSQSYMASDQSTKFYSPETNKSSESDNPKFKIKLEKTPSPVGLSEGEESRDRENNVKEKVLDIAVTTNLVNGSFPFTLRKNIVFAKEETGNGGHGQGRTGRYFPFTRPSGNFVLESETVPPTKQLQCMKRGPDKNRSKSGRPPVKKLKDRKVPTRAGPVLNSGKSVCTGGQNGDREELLAAANSARNASHAACSGLVWKETEPLFASVSPKDLLYLKQQLSVADNLNESLGQFFRYERNLSGDVRDKKVSDCSGQSNDESGSISEGLNMGRRLDSVPTLYERLISSLIDEDEIEEFYHQDEGRNTSFQSVSDDSHCGSCIDESEVDFQAQKPCILDRLSCNRSVSSNAHSSNRSVSSSLCNSEQWQADDGLSSFDVGNTSRISHSDPYVPILSPANASGGSITDSQYQLMSLDERIALELQSVGLYPDNMSLLQPELAERENGLNQEIAELQRGLLQNVGEVKKCLGKIDKEIESSRISEMRAIEQRAMDDLVVMAYRKIATSRNSNSSRGMARRVPKEVALAFGKRALARCHKFEETGSSCFLEPPFKDILFSTTLRNKEIESIKVSGPGAVTNPYHEGFTHKATTGSSAVFSNVVKNEYHSWGRQREGLLNNLAGSGIITNGEMLTNSTARVVERKAKAKPKQKTENGIHPVRGGGGGGGGQSSGRIQGNHHPKEEKGTTDFANLPLNELDSIDLGMNKDGLGGTQDLSSWLNFEEDGSFDHGDSSMGLEIPMDDLSDLQMLM
ncbi:uncharacterized protein LOC124929061 isoform X2 [Impatiens glandulifera]|uniref:uncharacterized protein LOC124929061 isoform X2 n=1 Tax=Impatiens glandulifera TaxID=253017 RepID=UPI001FB0F2A2|nr:uncharacterized protein LOC124929061 isoform X2 [Impatiens glandulifera]